MRALCDGGRAFFDVSGDGAGGVAVDELVSDLAYWHVMDSKREGTMNGGMFASGLAILKTSGTMRCTW
jgi:hypothetical protein